MRRFKPLIICILFLFIACACGQKGPLYLPQAQNPAPTEDQVKEEEKEAAEKSTKDGGINVQNP
jgi:predicted small lipoprotein YifL